jgi:hypothetical protein
LLRIIIMTRSIHPRVNRQHHQPSIDMIIAAAIAIVVVVVISVASCVANEAGG